MTHPETTPASADDRRAERARTEEMTVRPLRDGRYVVETDGGVYVVDLDERDCTCPDYAIRNARCKHLRRVAIEITERRVPAPHQRRAVCAVCGRQLYAPIHDAGPHLCERHDHEPGDLVTDRESGSMLVVVESTGCAATDVTTEEGRPVADYPTNAAYGGHEPVFRAAYVDSIAPTDDFSQTRAYSFPASRLVPTDREFRIRPSPTADNTEQATLT